MKLVLPCRVSIEIVPSLQPNEFHLLYREWFTHPQIDEKAISDSLRIIGNAFLCDGVSAEVRRSSWVDGEGLGLEFEVWADRSYIAKLLVSEFMGQSAASVPITFADAVAANPLGRTPLIDFLMYPVVSRFGAFPIPPPEEETIDR